MVEFGTRSAVLTGEQSHGCHIVETKGTGIVQLQLIIEFTVGGSSVDATAVDRPADRLGVVGILLPRDISRVGVDPFSLRVVIEVVDTSSALHHGIVKRQAGVEAQSAGDEVELLIQDEVSGDLCVGELLVTARCQQFDRVEGVGVTRSVEAIGAVAVDRAHGIGCRVVDGRPVTVGVATLAPWEVAHAIAAEQVDRELGGVGQSKVKVRTHVDAVVTKTRMIAAVVAELLEKVTLMGEVHRSEVLHVFRTAADIHTGIVRHGIVAEELFLPVYVGIAVPIVCIGGIAVFIDDRHGLVAAPGIG